MKHAFLFFALLLALPGFSAEKAVSKNQIENSQDQGLFSSLVSVLKSHRKKYQQLVVAIEQDPSLKLHHSHIHDMKIHPLFLQSILLHSDKSFLGMIQNDACSFYAALENNLLVSTKGRISKVIVNIKTKQGIEKPAIISLENFADFIHKKECPNNKKKARLFSTSHIRRTLKALKVEKPKKVQECLNILDTYKSGTNTPYLCRIPAKIKEANRLKRGSSSKYLKDYETQWHIDEVIKEGSILEKKLTPFQYQYIENLCTNLFNPDKFCAPYSSSDIWNRIIEGNLPLRLMKYKCRNILKKKKLSPDDLLTCRKKLLANPQLCVTSGNKNHPSLIPMPDCIQLELALESSKIMNDFHDCPGNLDNEGITNIHRIIMHLKPRDIASTPERCFFEASHSFVKLNKDFNNKNAWPLEICFFDPVHEAQVCRSYIPGAAPENKLSEINVISSILHRSVGMPPKTRCKLIRSKSYRPTRLGFKLGCFIIYDPNNCTPLHCTKKIIYDRKEIKTLKYRGRLTFDYIPNSFSNTKFSMTNVISETYYLKPRAITSTTEFYFFMKLKGKGIIHGIACAEDILPHFFHKKVINQCHPLPFIVDGFKKHNEDLLLVTRTALDDIHSPRLINWNLIISGVSNYKKLHPLRTWSFYGIK